MFKVGQKLVCIDESPFKGDRGFGNPSELKKNEIYTVDFLTRNGLGVILVEFPQNEYHKDRFRPLELDYSFVEKVISQLKKQPETV